MSAVTAAAPTEEVVSFPSGEETLVGIVTTPPAAARDVAVLFLNDAPYTTTPQRNRTAVRLSRLLAERGFASLRFDWHGVGESSGARLEPRDQQRVASDVKAAVALLEDMGHPRIAVVGTCYGAWAALVVGASLPRVAGLALLTALLDLGAEAPGGRRGGRALMRRRPPPGVAPAAAEQLEVAARRALPILVVECEDRPSGRALETLRRRQLRRVLERPGVETVVLPGRGFLLARLERQERIIDLLPSWLARL